MKKITFLTAFVMLFSLMSFGQLTDLIISEYGEGSSGNSKYIEIYNGTGATVDLTKYKLWFIANGGTWPETQYVFTTATLANGVTLVIANNATDVPGANEYTTTISFNGDDAIGIAKDDGSGTFVLLDAEGSTVDPGSGWNVAGTTNATVDHILIRKETVCLPNTDWTASAGTDATNSEWIVSSTTYTTGAPISMGNHTANCTVSTTPELTWSATTFNEAIANDGSISNTLTLALANETFTTTLGQLVVNIDYTVANVPAGLTLAIGTSNNQTAVIGITGNATNHANIDDIANLTITFLNAAFTGNDASAVTASSKTDLVVDFMDGAPAKEMAWSATSFTENIANNGSISNTITVSLTSETFTTVGALVSGTDFGVLNVPAGLTVEITTTSATAATISLNGTATSHTNSDDIANLSIAFLDNAFTGGSASSVAYSNKTDLVVDFMDAYVIPNLVFTEIMYNPAEANTDSTEFFEIYNNGSTPVNLENYYLSGVTYVFGNITLNAGEYVVVGAFPTAIQHLFGVTAYQFTGGLSNGGEIIKLLNPAGATVDSVSFDDTSFWPNADESGHSIVLCDYNANNSLAASWTISTNYIGLDDEHLKVWASPMTSDVVCTLNPGITWSATTFAENIADDGSISTVVTLTLTDESFVTVVGTLVSGSDYTVANVPAGLTAVITTTSATEATISLTGNAIIHDSDISNLTITFTDTAFVSGFATNVLNSNKTDLVIDFISPLAPELTWSATTFTEAIANDGSISNNISLLLIDETFATVGILAETTYYTVANVPVGLTAVITTTSATEATISLTGTATSHTNSDDIANLTITFLNAAFTGDDASIVATSSKTDLVVDFMDTPPSPEVVWNNSTFNEVLLNNGAIENNISVSLIAETFATVATLTETTDYTVANVPAGLTAVVTTTSATAATISLTGTATNHANSDDIANLTITFLNAAFTGDDASAVTASSKTDLVVDFMDTYVIPNLVFTEIMYNPAEANTDTTEFVEIYNNGSTNVNLNGYYFFSAFDYVFGNVTINAGEYLVVALNSASMLNTFGVTAYQFTSGALSNSGETIKLLNPVGATVDSVLFDDTSIWPNADGSGHSIVLCDYNADNSLASSWTISTNYVGINADLERMWASPMQADVVCTLNPEITWSATTFEEAIANDGSISTIVSLTLTDDAFVTVGALTENFDYTVANVPAGLTAVITTTSATQATISLNGNATAHTDADDIANLEIAFTDSAFVSGFVTNILNSNKTDLIVDFSTTVSINTVNNSNINIYPNPTKGLVNINGKNINKVEITDITGKIILTQDNTNSIDLYNEKQGVYFVKIYTNNTVIVEKIVLNK